MYVRVCVYVCSELLAVTRHDVSWDERRRERVSPDVSSSLRKDVCEGKGFSDFCFFLGWPTRHPGETSVGYEGFSGGCGGSQVRSVCLEVDQVEVRGGEVGAQSHVRVLQLPQDPPVELGADPVELHDVAGILLDPEAVELLHQVT